MMIGEYGRKLKVGYVRWMGIGNQNANVCEKWLDNENQHARMRMKKGKCVSDCLRVVGYNQVVDEAERKKLEESLQMCVRWDDEWEYFGMYGIGRVVAFSFEQCYGWFEKNVMGDVVGQNTKEPTTCEKWMQA